MKPPRELRAICQAGKENDPRWYAIHRRVSIYLTWALLHTRVAPTHVTVAMMVTGATGALLLASASLGLNAAGFALLYLAFLLDKVDGEIARYRRVQSPRAVVLDRFHHLAIEPLVLLAAAVREYGATGSTGVLVAALVAIALGNIVEEQKHLPAYAALKHLREGGQMPARRAASSGWSTAYTIMRPLKVFRMFIVVLATLAVAYAAQAATGGAVLRVYLFGVPVALAVYVLFQTVYYHQFKLEEELRSYQQFFKGEGEAGDTPVHPNTESPTLRSQTIIDIRDAHAARPRTVTGVER